ncbi:MAG: ABC transporter permease [Bacillota bacterium]|uniref:ABC transporter permease n=1 Tax=unclassified Virgibacillus TaxID=2620237 RepID=UPI000EF500B7|nr:MULTISPECIES: ABC transporter permease [unclassified Virgibacillus]MDY7044312.1 ABC transporter permease [Virgibacillus sp. M23]
MISLIKLELKKFKLNGYFLCVIVSNLVMTVLVWMMMLQWSVENTYIHPTYNVAFDLTRSMVNFTFVIFAAILMARIIVGEYVNKTTSVLFTYPIRRQKLLISKLALISLVTFVIIIISNLFINLVLIGLNVKYDFVKEPLTSPIISNQMMEILIHAVLKTMSSWIPLVLGMLRKSPTTTIVSVFIIEFTSISMNNGPTYTVTPAVEMTLAVIGAVGAYWMIYKAEREDIL